MVRIFVEIPSRIFVVDILAINFETACKCECPNRNIFVVLSADHKPKHYKIDAAIYIYIHVYM